MFAMKVLLNITEAMRFVKFCLKAGSKDKVFMRYITRMLKTGVLSEGELRVTDERVPQGSIPSWPVKNHCRGEVEMFRNADDIVCI